MATATAIGVSITALGLIVAGAFAVGYYLGEKHLSETEAQLQSLRDAQALPLESVVREAQRVIENLGDRLELDKMLEERDLTIASIGIEIERLNAREKELIEETNSLNNSISHLQELILPTEFSKQIHLVENKQEILPISNKVIGVIETYHRDSIEFAVDGDQHVVGKGSSVKFGFSGLMCVIIPMDWKCCSPREAIFHYECKRTE